MKTTIAPVLLLVPLLAACAASDAAGAAGPPQAAPADLRSLIAAAIAGGQEKAIIPPGVYRLAPEPGTAAVLFIRGAHDLEIAADGATLVCTRLARAIAMNDCRNVTIRGLTVDYDPLPFTQGTVTSAAEDKGWIDVRLHDGYPAKPYHRIDLVDPKTRFRKRGMPFLWGTKAEMVGPSTVRITLKGIGDAAQVGDLASLSTGPEPGFAPQAISIENSAGTTLDRVTIHSAPGMGIVDAGGEGGTHLMNCRVVPGPRPAGATEERLLTTSWDAILHKTMRKGPLVEGCVIESAGDDSWSVASSDYLVVNREGNAVVLVPRDEWAAGQLRAGDRLRTANDSPEVVIREVKAAAVKDAGLAPQVLDRLAAARQWTLWHVGRRCAVATLDRPPPFDVGQSVFCPDRQESGFVFRNNRVHSSGRGALVKASDGLIENNIFDCAHAAVTVCPEVPGEAAAGIRNLVIRANTIVGTGYFCPAPWSTQAGAISISAGLNGKTLRPPGVFDHIVIEGNTFRGVSGANIVVTSARDVLIKGNRFAATHETAPPATGRAYGIDQAAVIWLGPCDGVRLEDNVIERMGPFGRRALWIDPSAKNVTGAETGARVAED